ncbi:hypothetical protein PILCRDRAFT_275980 [Piloderma croceum F 1598]|uniref:Uncharacterized protein n=1 Tax=Piloderma croceum (strain F 1598) TaxID=765440 RepID=A0A0C3BLT3_PILCF|nr:hypothetical protein PILCRDRAFT_275980 [Piloderma croceum F 1598]
MLKKINIEVWLEDQEGEEIPHRVPTTERNKRNEINAIVEIEGGKAYTVHWRLAEGLEPISTWNDVFVVDASSESRKAAKSWMDKRKADTQTRSSDQRLETHFRNGLKTPRVPGENLGAVRLEIRRVRGEITVKCIKGQTDVITLDIIDDEREGKPPWTVFHFTFKNIGLKKARPAASAARGMRAPPSDVSACRDNYGIPSKPLSVSLVSAWPRYLTYQSTSSSTSQAGARCWRSHTVTLIRCGYFATRKAQAAPQEIIHHTFGIRVIFR